MSMRLRAAAGTALLGLTALAAGCGGSGSSDSAAPTPTSTAAKAAATTTATAAAGRRPDSDHNGVPDTITVKGGLGDTLLLEGSGISHDNADPENHTKTKIKVTLARLLGPIKGYDLAAGRKLIGVELRFANVGTLVYDDPQPDGALTVTGGESGRQTSLIALSGKNACDNPSVKLRPGESKQACLAFDVPASSKPMTFQYVSDYNYGDTGVWKLG